MRHFIIFIIVLFSLPLHAHSWLEDAKPLTEGDVISVIQSIENQNWDDLLQPSVPDQTVTFLKDMIDALNDGSGNTERILFMFGAIQAGAFNEQGYSETADIDWFGRIRSDDFDVVNSKYEELNRQIDQLRMHSP